MCGVINCLTEIHPRAESRKDEHEQCAIRGRISASARLKIYEANQPISDFGI